VEEALLTHPAVAAAAVVGLPDAKLGERACAVIEVAPGQQTPNLAELRDYLTTDQRLAIWKVPERLEVTEKWPVTATGKVQKYVLRETFRTDN
jgi:non-ribosomal peptide synthetase component E (peptide arylation enzyme)